MKHPIYLLITLFLLNCCVPIDQGKSSAGNHSYPSLAYADHVYSNSVKTVQLYKNNGSLRNQSEPAVAHIGQNNLILEFDDLTVDAKVYRARIINCTADWRKSSVSNIDYLFDFNEFDINDYEFSLDTEVPYVHYQFPIPKIKLPGNYVLVIYRGTNPQDLVLSKRFMVYDNKVNISSINNISGLANLSRLNQQIEFILHYPDYELVNPLENVSVHIRQNQRWDNMVSHVVPSFVREDLKELEYRFFNNIKNFSSGNEFRFFDLRSLRYPGQNILDVKEEMSKDVVYIMPDGPRNKFSYAQYIDNNGGYIIDNRDAGNPKYSSEYNKVRFTLNTKKIKLKGDVYVFGALTNWATTKNNKMVYDEASKKYTAELLLKQGYYDYSYYYKSDSVNQNYFEGSHFETENEYEIFVYYRPYNSRTDLLVGYLQIRKNKRLNR